MVTMTGVLLYEIWLADRQTECMKKLQIQMNRGIAKTGGVRIGGLHVATPDKSNSYQYKDIQENILV